MQPVVLVVPAAAPAPAATTTTATDATCSATPATELVAPIVPAATVTFVLPLAEPRAASAPVPAPFLPPAAPTRAPAGLPVLPMPTLPLQDAAVEADSADARAHRPGSGSGSAPATTKQIPPEQLPDHVPTPTSAPGGAASSGGGGSGSGGAFSAVGGDGRDAVLSVHAVRQQPAETLLPEGNRVTLALDRPG